jgi:hypothetical protein
MSDLVRDEAGPRPELLGTPRGVTAACVLAAPTAPEAAEAVHSQHVARIRPRRSRRDLVVVDAGSMLDERVMTVLSDTIIPVYEIAALR